MSGDGEITVFWKPRPWKSRWNGTARIKAAGEWGERLGVPHVIVIGVDEESGEMHVVPWGGRSPSETVSGAIR